MAQAPRRRRFRTCIAGCASRISRTRRSISRSTSVQERLQRRQAHRRARRGILARQVRAHQRDLLRRLRSAAPAGVRRAHDDVPDRASLRPGASAPSIRLLPIETRLKDATVQELRTYADEWTTFPLDLSDAAKMSAALGRVSEVKRVPVALARALGLQDDDSGAAEPPCRQRRRPRRRAVLAARDHQLSSSAAAAGPRRSSIRPGSTPSARNPSSRSTSCRARRSSCSSSPPIRASPRPISRCGGAISPATIPRRRRRGSSC